MENIALAVEKRSREETNLDIAGHAEDASFCILKELEHDVN
jgi:hypothetical protein